MPTQMTYADREKYRKQSKMVRISDLHHELLTKLARQRTTDPIRPVTFRQLAERGYSYLEFEDAVGLDAALLRDLYHAAGGDPARAREAFYEAVGAAIERLRGGRAKSRAK